MSEILNAKIVLVLNAAWRAVNEVTVQKAFENLFSESHGRPAALAMDMESAVDENGQEVLVRATPTRWEDWVKLPVRPGDLSIHSAHLHIRVPTIIIAANYDKIPMCTPRLSKGAIAKRDGHVCQYTKEYTGPHGGNIDHVIARDKGGRDTWENLVWCKKDINSMKGNRFNHEAGLQLIRKPKAPPSIPRLIRRDEAKHPSWKLFLDV